MSCSTIVRVFKRDACVVGHRIHENRVDIAAEVTAVAVEDPEPVAVDGTPVDDDRRVEARRFAQRDESSIDNPSSPNWAANASTESRVRFRSPRSMPAK